MNTLKHQKNKSTFPPSGNQVATIKTTKLSAANALQKVRYHLFPSDIIGDIVKREFKKITIGRNV